jgi:hypothetical protein
VRLEWTGFVPATGALHDQHDHFHVDAATRANIEQTLESLLRRFERV